MFIFKSILMCTSCVSLVTLNVSLRGVGPFKLALQDDGNLVIYSNNIPIWATHTDQVNPPLPGSANTLGNNQALAPGGALTSADGAYKLLYQVIAVEVPAHRT
jgi:hypothetical protein